MFFSPPPRLCYGAMLSLFVVPYDSAQEGVRMGAGPRALQRLLPDAPRIEIRAPEGFRAEIRTSFDLYAALATSIGDRHQDSTPVVFSGNCGASIGTAAGLGVDDLVLVWFDAHGDFMRPETTVTGFLDGMALSVVTGHAWQALAKAIPGHQPLPAERVLHVGARDFNDGELEEIRAAGVDVAPPPLDREAVARQLDRLATKGGRALIHVDLDVIDPQFGTANHFAAPGGLSPDDVCDVITMIKERFAIAGLVLASYDPSGDPGAGIVRAASAIVATLDS